METKAESRVYRVEAFIIPKVNSATNSEANTNEIDDVKFANKLKFCTSLLAEQADEEENSVCKSNNSENLSFNQVESEPSETAENLSSDSSKKASINSFNEYQEEPDFEILIKSPELLETYSRQIDKDHFPTEQNGEFSSLKKCLVDFLAEKGKVQNQSFIGERESEGNLEVEDVKTSEKENESTSFDVIEEIKEAEEEKPELKRKEEIEEKKEISEKKLENQIEEGKFKLPAFTDFHSPLLKLDEPVYDEPFVGNLERIPKKSKESLDSDVELYSSSVKTQGNNRVTSKSLKKCNSLKSIDEGVELVDVNFEDFCHHGHKNGCTVVVQKPEDVTQEIFKENWLHRLEILRQREALLRDKEVALQSRERLLFKKEKELRILERMVKDKMKQAELYLKRCKNSQSLRNVFDGKVADSQSSNDSESFKAGFVLNSVNAEKRVPFIGESLWLKAPELQFKVTKDNLKTLPLRNSSETIPSDVKYGSKFNPYNSLRCRQRPKISYDDMDSTLSADAGDASFVVTSRKFDPVIFKKPAAFSRSASERRPRGECRKEKFSTGEYSEFEENKILRKVSENILVSQDKDTKFLNYGIIDKDVKNLCTKLTRENEERKYGYLNLEVDNKGKKKDLKGLKNRPISWSAETDDWLQRKRGAFNSANQKCVQSCDKENLESKSAGKQSSKKKSGKGRKFSIFR